MKNFTLFLILSFLFISCDSNKTDDFIACTNELRVSNIQVQHKDGTPYALDSVKTFIEIKDRLKNISHFEDFDNIFFHNCQEDGTYPVVGDIDDRHFPDFVRPTKYNEIKFIGEVQFVGYKADKELFRKKIKVYTDACHISCDEKDLAVIDLE